jgi:hypothetical protein
MKALVFALFLASTAAVADDARQFVKLPPPAQDALREEMQGNLVALNEVLSLLAVGVAYLPFALLTQHEVPTIRSGVSLAALGIFCTALASSTALARHARASAKPFVLSWQTPQFQSAVSASRASGQTARTMSFTSDSSLRVGAGGGDGRGDGGGSAVCAEMCDSAFGSPQAGMNPKSTKNTPKPLRMAAAYNESAERGQSSLRTSLSYSSALSFGFEVDHRRSGVADSRRRSEEPSDRLVSDPRRFDVAHGKSRRHVARQMRQERRARARRCRRRARRTEVESAFRFRPRFARGARHRKVRRRIRRARFGLDIQKPLGNKRIRARPHVFKSRLPDKVFLNDSVDMAVRPYPLGRFPGRNDRLG